MIKILKIVMELLQLAQLHNNITTVIDSHVAILQRNRWKEPCTDWKSGPGVIIITDPYQCLLLLLLNLALLLGLLLTMSGLSKIKIVGGGRGGGGGGSGVITTCYAVFNTGPCNAQVWIE